MENGTLDCLSVGILVADHICAPIDRMPDAGDLVLTDELQLTIGGCASNAAVDMARVGVNVSVVGCVGDDSFGHFIIDALRAANVETSGIHLLSGVGTSGTLIVNVRGQDRRFIHTLGANARMSATHIPFDRVKLARVLYVGGYLLMPALEQDALAELFQQARAAGVRTVLDVVLPGPGDYMPRLERLLPHTDVFLPNTDEARVITGLADPRAQADRLHAAGAGAAVITCGGEGTVLVGDGLRLFAAPYRMPFVGATGAGDAFDAGYITGMLRGSDPRMCLAWGSALGASCVRAIGATESVFTRDEAEAFLRDNPLQVSEW